MRSDHEPGMRTPRWTSRPFSTVSCLRPRARPGLWGSRSTLAGTLLIVDSGDVCARYYWDRGQVSDQDMMARIAFQAFLWMLAVNLGMVFGVAARAVARRSRWRKTAARLISCSPRGFPTPKSFWASSRPACRFCSLRWPTGLPIMLLMNPLGGIDLRLILLAYAGVITTGVFHDRAGDLGFIGAIDSRRAAGCIGSLDDGLADRPLVGLAGLYTRHDFVCRASVLTANAWILSSSPMGLMFKIGGGVTPSSGLLDAVAWMSGLQVAGGALLIVWTIARLRSAYRRNVSGDSQSLAARLTRPGWRWRPKPAVGDDPILWREMNLARGGLLVNVLGLVITVGMYSTLGYVTYFFTRPAAGRGLAARLLVGDHQRRTTGIESGNPVLHVGLRTLTRRLTLPGPSSTCFCGTSRHRFIFIITLVAAGMASEGIVSERAARDLGQLDRHAAYGARHPAQQNAGHTLAHALAPDDRAWPVDDWTACRGDSSRSALWLPRSCWPA